MTQIDYPNMFRLMATDSEISRKTWRQLRIYKKPHSLCESLVFPLFRVSIIEHQSKYQYCWTYLEKPEGSQLSP
jgi:hypothetical protein